MTEPDDTSFPYSVDANDMIVALGPSWLEFAIANGAPELAHENVVGRSLWEFVVGGEVRSVYTVLFRWVRDYGAVLSIPFRCDSPSRRRSMKLELTPASFGRIDLVGRLLAESEQPFLSLLADLAHRAPQQVEMCSFCKRLRVGDDWLEAPEALERLGLADALHPPRASQRVCDPCYARCEQVLSPGSY